MTIKSRPMIFSADSVRKIIAGNKKQTRRVVKDCRCLDLEDDEDREKCRLWGEEKYGKPGDLLWVKETFQRNFSCHVSHNGYLFKSTAATDQSHHGYWAKDLGGGAWVDHYDRLFTWRSPLFMPRFAARLFLEITSVRVEMVRQISREDRIAEGVASGSCVEFEKSWDALNANRGYAWKSNPRVWAISFKVVQPAPSLPPPPTSRTK